MEQGMEIIFANLTKEVYTSVMISFVALVVFIFYYRGREIKKMYINKYDIIETWIVKVMFLVGITMAIAPLLLSIADLVVLKTRPVGILINEGLVNGLTSSEKYSYATVLSGSSYADIIKDYYVYWVANNIAKLGIAIYFAVMSYQLIQMVGDYVEKKKKDSIEDPDNAKNLTVKAWAMRSLPIVSLVVSVSLIAVYGYNTYLYMTSPESIDAESVKALLRSL